MKTTTITIDRELKARLDGYKRHRKEPYSEVLRRLVGSVGTINGDSIDWKETAEILSDPEAMRSIARGIEDLRAGRLVDIEDL